jgi:hypothetical protein
METAAHTMNTANTTEAAANTIILGSDFHGRDGKYQEKLLSWGRWNNVGVRNSKFFFIYTVREA